MYIVIKGTKTVAEFKELKAYMEQRAREHYQDYKQVFGNWTDDYK